MSSLKSSIQRKFFGHDVEEAGGEVFVYFPNYRNEKLKELIEADVKDKMSKVDKRNNVNYTFSHFDGISELRIFKTI